MVKKSNTNNKENKMRYNMGMFKKAVSLLVIFTFICTNMGFALDGPPPKDQGQAELVLTSDAIGVPKDFGTIKDRFAGKDSRLIIHIQDAHCNYEAQTNIANILETLYKDYSIDFVSLEGADGMIDTAWFKAFPDADIRKEVADYFMKKGEITGAEFLSITTEYPLTLYGAETRDLYIKNLNAFTSTYPSKDMIEKYLLSIRSVLNRLKGYIYSKALKEIDSKIADYKEKRISLSEYAKFLNANIRKHDIPLHVYPDFGKLVYTLQYEDKIDFKIVDQERSALIDFLSKELSKEALSDLVLKSFSFKTGKVTSAEYYEYLKGLSEQNGVDLQKDYPNLRYYCIYTRLYEKINNEMLFKEIHQLKELVKENVITNDDQRALNKLSNHVDILIDLINIKLANGDYAYYTEHKDEFDIDEFLAFINAKKDTYNLAFETEDVSYIVRDNLPKLAEFYELAVIRDKALVDNTLKGMKSQNDNVGILVTGGFHTEGITKLLREKDVSYVVICPTITKEVESPYIQVLTNQRTPLEQLLLEDIAPSEKGVLGAAVVSRAMYWPEDALSRAGKGITKLSSRIKGFIQDWIELHKWLWITDKVDKAKENSLYVYQKLGNDIDNVLAHYYSALLGQNLSLVTVSGRALPYDIAIQDSMLASPAVNTAAGAVNMERVMQLRQEGRLSQDDFYNIEWLVESRQFGPAAAQYIEHLMHHNNVDGLKRFAGLVAPRRRNIESMVNALNRDDYADGYDVLIMGFPTKEEAEYRQKQFDALLAHMRTKNKHMDKRVKIITVVSLRKGGQFLSQGYAIYQAEKKFPEFRELFKGKKIKVGIIWDGGAGTRAATLGLSYYDVRGAQNIVGKFMDSKGEMHDLDLFTAVVLQVLPYGRTIEPGMAHTWWSSQLGFPDFDLALTKTPPVSLAKMARQINLLDERGNPKSVYDLGTAVWTPELELLLMYGNRRFAIRDANGEWEVLPEFDQLANMGMVGFDFGSFGISAEMLFAIADYMKWMGIVAEIEGTGDADPSRKADIDPGFIQPLAALKHIGKHVDYLIPGVLLGKKLRDCLEDSDISAKMLAYHSSVNKVYGQITKMTKEEIEATNDPVFQGVIRELQAKDARYNHLIQQGDDIREEKKQERSSLESEIRRFKDALGFMLIFIDSEEIFPPASSGRFDLGVISLGRDLHWWRYRRPIDVANEKFVMLQDLVTFDTTRKKIFLNEQCVPEHPNVDELDIIEAEDARRIRRIPNESVCEFTMYEVDQNGVSHYYPMKLTADQVRDGGWFGVNDKGETIYVGEGEGVFVEGSVIRDSVIKKGSRIVNSVVNRSAGFFELSDSAYVENSSVIRLIAKHGFVLNVNDILHRDGLVCEGKFIADVYSYRIQDPRRVHKVGHTRVILPLNYDPDGKGMPENMDDKHKVYDNIYSIKDLRALLEQDGKKRQDGTVLFEMIKRETRMAIGAAGAAQEATAGAITVEGEINHRKINALLRDHGTDIVTDEQKRLIGGLWETRRYRKLVRPVMERLVKAGDVIGLRDFVIGFAGIVADLENMVRQKEMSARQAYGALYLWTDTADFGPVAKRQVELLLKRGTIDRLKELVDTVVPRRRNIERSLKVLKREEYNGYNLLVLGFPTPEEAEYRQKQFDELFKHFGTLKVIAVVSLRNGGQLLSMAHAVQKQIIDKAKALGIEDLQKSINDGSVKMCMIWDAGKAKRTVTLGLSYYDVRGAQNIVGTYEDFEGAKHEMDLITAVVLQVLPYGSKIKPGHVHVWWASQLAYPDVDIKNLTMSAENLAKMQRDIPDVRAVPGQDAFDLGKTLSDIKRRMILMFRNKIFASFNKKIGAYVPTQEFHELANGKAAGLFGGRTFVGDDFGSFSISGDMLFAVAKYWKDRGIFDNVSIQEGRDVEEKDTRDVDPSFIQPLSQLLLFTDEIAEGLRGRNLYRDVYTKNTEEDAEILRLAVDFMFSRISGKVKELFQRLNLVKLEEDLKKPGFERDMKDVIEFYLLNRHDKGIFPDKGSDRAVLGIVSLGRKLHWWRYRRPIDTLNEKLIMLSDIIKDPDTEQDQKIQIVIKTREDAEGRIERTIVSDLSPSDSYDRIEAEDARALRGIPNDAVCEFWVDHRGGQKIVLSAEQVRTGVRFRDLDIEIRGSVILNSVLRRGSTVINSVVNNFEGWIDARNSYVESTVYHRLNISNGFALNVCASKSDRTDHTYKGEFVADIYSGKISDDRLYHARNQARMVLELDYDPDTSDGHTIAPNKYSVSELRDGELLEGRKETTGHMRSIAEEIARINYQDHVKEQGEPDKGKAGAVNEQVLSVVRQAYMSSDKFVRLNATKALSRYSNLREVLGIIRVELKKAKRGEQRERLQSVEQYVTRAMEFRGSAGAVNAQAELGKIKVAAEISYVDAEHKKAAREGIQAYLEAQIRDNAVSEKALSALVAEIVMAFNASDPTARQRSEMVFYCQTLVDLGKKYKYQEIVKIATEEVEKLLRGEIVGPTVNPFTFRRDSIRAVAETELPDDVAEAAGKALAYLLAKYREKSTSDLTIATGRDSRISGERLLKAFIEGFISTGGDVVNVAVKTEANRYGVTSTPLMYFASRFIVDKAGRLVDGITEKTASHLTDEWNGIKPTIGVVNISEAQMLEWLDIVLDILDGKEFQYVTERVTPKKGEVTELDILPYYQLMLKASMTPREHLGGKSWKEYVREVQRGEKTLKEVLEEARPFVREYEKAKPLKGIKIAIDAGNGSMGPIAAPVFKDLGAEVVELFCEADGKFTAPGRHQADPTKPENMVVLRETVINEGCNLGLGFDADGDRMIIYAAIDSPEGKKVVDIPGDDIMSILLPYMFSEVSREDLARTVIVPNVMCSDRPAKIVERLREEHGFTDEECPRAEEGPVGFSKLKAKMAALRDQGFLAPLSGEVSAHIMIDENFDADDGLFAACKLLGYLNREAGERGIGLGEVIREKTAGLPEQWITPESSLTMVSDTARLRVAEALKRTFLGLTESNPDRYRLRNSFDGVKIDYLREGESVGFLLIRPSGTSPEIKIRASSLASRQDYEEIMRDLGSELADFTTDIEWAKNKPEEFARTMMEALPAETQEQINDAGTAGALDAIEYPEDSEIGALEGVGLDVLAQPAVSGMPTPKAAESEMARVVTAGRVLYQIMQPEYAVAAAEELEPAVGKIPLTKSVVFVPQQIKISRKFRQQLESVGVSLIPYEEYGVADDVNKLIDTIKSVVTANEDVRFTILGTKRFFQLFQAQAGQQGSRVNYALTEGFLKSGRMLAFNPAKVTKKGEYAYPFVQEMLVAAIALTRLDVSDLNDKNPVYRKLQDLLAVITGQSKGVISREIHNLIIGDKAKPGLVVYQISQMLMHLLVDMQKVDYEKVRREAEAARNVLWSL